MTKDKSMRVPYGKSVHGEDEVSAVVRVLRDSTQMGSSVRNFEARIAKLFGKQHGVMVNSGSSANYLAVELLGLPAGSEVITPALTFATTVAPLIKNGLVPVFVDVEPDTFNLDADQLETAIGPKTRAIMAPSLIGNLPDWDAIAQVAKKHDLYVIEDSADTLGATLRGQTTGARSDISTTSFYGSHVINCAGNGGMLCVNREEWRREAVLLRSWGRDSSLFAPPQSPRLVADIAADNAVYRRSAILEHPDLLITGFWEPSFHRRFHAQGLTLAVDPDILVNFRGCETAGAFARYRRLHGREYGESRARDLALAHRLAFLVASPAIPFLMATRLVGRALRRRTYGRALLLAWPWVSWFILNWSVGEISGYVRAVIGPARGEKRDDQSRRGSAP